MFANFFIEIFLLLKLSSLVINCPYFWYKFSNIILFLVKLVKVLLNAHLVMLQNLE